MTATSLHSALYTGRVWHRRYRPQAHAFRYSLFMLYLDLEELDQVFQGRWFWSARRRALARFDRRDHFGDASKPLDECVRDRVERETGRRPGGPIRLLTHLRYFGYCFNPISIFYCFDQTENLTALVIEVTNTPWRERRCYVLEIDTGTRCYRFPKTLHVSPFMPMDLDYDWRSNKPGQRLTVTMTVSQNDSKLFDASLALHRAPITGFTLTRTLLRFPWMTIRVIWAIYWQALRLWLKKLPVFDHKPLPKSVEDR